MGGSEVRFITAHMASTMIIFTQVRTKLAAKVLRLVRSALVQRAGMLFVCALKPQPWALASHVTGCTWDIHAFLNTDIKHQWPIACMTTCSYSILHARGRTLEATNRSRLQPAPLLCPDAQGGQ